VALHTRQFEKAGFEPRPLHRDSRKLRGKEEVIQLPRDEALDITAVEMDRIKYPYGNDTTMASRMAGQVPDAFILLLGKIHSFFARFRCAFS